MIVIGQRPLNMRRQLIIRHIRNAQHIDARILQRPAKLPIVRRKVRGNKHKIGHACPLPGV